MSNLEIQPFLDTSHAPAPTPKTLARRQNLAFQFWRFIVYSLRIMRMVMKGKH